MWSSLFVSGVLLALVETANKSGCSKTEEDLNRCLDEDGDSGEPYYVWIGVVSGTVVFAIVVFTACVCCRCCALNKRRRAHEALLAASMAQRDHVSSNLAQSQPPYVVFPGEVDSQRPYTIQTRLGSCQAAPEPTQSLHMYNPSAPPVFFDEPPPKYTP